MVSPLFSTTAKPEHDFSSLAIEFPRAQRDFNSRLRLFATQSSEKVTLAIHNLPPLKGLALTGKFGPTAEPIYDVKRRFEAAGIPVAFPVGAHPLAHFRGYTFSDPIEERVPFWIMQRAVFEIIQRSPVHLVCIERENCCSKLGYSTALELAWALMCSKPVIISSRIHKVSAFIPSDILEIILSRQRYFTEVSLLAVSRRELHACSSGRNRAPIHYDLSHTERAVVLKNCEQLLQIEHLRWRDWLAFQFRQFDTGEVEHIIIDPHEILYGCHESPASYLPREEWIAHRIADGVYAPGFPSVLRHARDLPAI